MKSATPVYIYFIPLWPISGIIAWALVNWVRETKREKLSERSLDWPRTTGVVRTSEIVFDHVEVQYTYSIDAKEYSGVFKDGLPPALPDRSGLSARGIASAAKMTISDYPVGAKLILNYNPQNPSQSSIYCVDPGSQSTKMPPTEDVPTFGTLD